MKPYQWSALILFVLLQSCATTEPDKTEPYRLALQRTLPVGFPIPEKPPTPSIPGFYPEATPETAEYRRRLKAKSGWDGVPVAHYLGRIPCRGRSGTVYQLGLSVYLPPGTSRGTFLFIHGYLSYGGYFSWIFDQLVRRGWTVVSLDLPGHGFSTGLRSDMVDFRDYGDSVRAFLDWASSQQDRLPRPWILAGHSLGGGSILEYLRTLSDLPQPGAAPDLVVLAAPLVRTVAFDASQFGYFLLGGMIKNLPPVFSPDGYLGGSTFPTHWFKAVSDWNAGLDQAAFAPLPTFVVQGTKDGVVDAGYNIPFLKKKLPQAQFIMLDGFSHNLLEDDQEKAQTLEVLLENWKARGLGQP